MRATTTKYIPLYIVVFLISIGGSLVIAIGVMRIKGEDHVGESGLRQSSGYDTGSQVSAAPKTQNALLMPTITPTPTPDPIPATVTPPAPSPPIPPTPIHRPAHSAVELTGFRHEWQTWNNCGPATLSMYLSYFGSPLSQADIGAVPRPYPDDKNVSPVELVEFDEASNAFDRAQQIGFPLRMLWYQFEPFAAYYATGRFEDVVALADGVLAATQSVEEIYYWKGLGLAAGGDTAAAREAWRRAAALNPSHEPTRSARDFSSE